MRSTSYGKRGGDGPTRGLKAAIYSVRLPDGTIATKRSYFAVDNARAYAYYSEPDKRWYVAGINVANCAHLSHYQQLECERIK